MTNKEYIKQELRKLGISETEDDITDSLLVDCFGIVCPKESRNNSCTECRYYKFWESEKK